jgi:hypothetical protein
MSDEPVDDLPLSPEEEAALSALRRDREPPPVVEERLLAALRTAAPGRGRRSLLVSGLGYAAALALGLALGRGSRSAAPPLQPRFLLLLYEDTGFVVGSPAEQQARVRQYSAWARERAREGRLLSGEKLEEVGEELRGALGPAPLGRDRLKDEPRGFFVVVAPDAAAAAAIAAGCPHLRHGGRIVVRPIA